MFNGTPGYFLITINTLGIERIIIIYCKVFPDWVINTSVVTTLTHVDVLTAQCGTVD